MLKRVILTIAAVSALAGIANAANPGFITDLTNMQFKTSSLVKMAYKEDGLNKPQQYTVIAKHTSGDTYYGASSGSTNIMKQQGASFLGVPLALGDTQVSGPNAGETVWSGGGTWTAM
jgi:hypothetical protein